MKKLLVLGFLIGCGASAHAQTYGPQGVGGGTGTVLGTVDIDQATPGTTNGVVVNSGTVTASGSVANSNDVAQGATTSGQVGPLMQGAVVTTQPTYSNGQTSPITLTTRGQIPVTVSFGNLFAALQSGGADGVSNGSASLVVTGDNASFNGATWDRIRGNIDAAASLVALSAAGAGTVNSADQVNYNGSCVTVVVDITVAGGTPTLTVTLQGKDIASGKYYTLLASTALASVATTPLVVCPGTTVSANLDVAAPLPRTWRVSAVVGGVTPAVTATIGASVTK